MRAGRRSGQRRQDPGGSCGGGAWTGALRHRLRSQPQTIVKQTLLHEEEGMAILTLICPVVVARALCWYCGSDQFSFSDHVPGLRSSRPLPVLSIEA